VNIIDNRRKHKTEKKVVRNGAVSDPDPDEATIPTGSAIINMARAKMIKLIISDITRNGQKFLAAALKNPDNEDFPEEALRLSKIPPFRKAPSNIPIRISNNNPIGKEDIRFLKPEPISPNTSRSIPSFSLSVIMLPPNADLMNPFIGNATRETVRSDPSQISNIPFHAFRVLQKPDARALNIFITN
jgi:hypothetical protein